MIELEGKTFKANIMIKQRVVTSDIQTDTFVKALESGLIKLCRSMDVPIPLWLSKNTHEFAAFKQTIFFSDQFTEDVKFDRFQIRLIQYDG